VLSRQNVLDPDAVCFSKIFQNGGHFFLVSRPIADGQPFLVHFNGAFSLHQSFDKYLKERFSQLTIDELTPEVLSSAFATYDPVYYQGYLTQQAKADKDKIAKENQQAFGEPDDVRTNTPAPKLTKQQEHMEGMLDEF